MTLPINAKEENLALDAIKLSYLDKDFVLDCMSVPTSSKKEQRMVEFIVFWALRNQISYEFDSYGNLYLTKGEVADGEFFPCVTSHLDTVHSAQDPYIEVGVPLDLKIENDKGTHRVSVETHGGTSIGVGADDKGGVCICLSLFNHFDKLKACFFLCEEIGCLGSKELNVEWFKDVGYVIGFDSPELYRAAWSCNGVKLFSYDFYLNHMKEVCDKWGLTNGCFFSEPYTDVTYIREKTNIICMNFGNGGYNPHMSTEYFIIEEMDDVCGMSIELIQSIGNTEHKLEHTTKKNTTYYEKDEKGIYRLVDTDDSVLLAALGDNIRKNAYTTKTTTSTPTIKYESFKYVVNRYESFIEGLKDAILETTRDCAEKNGYNLDDLEEAIKNKFNTEIKF